LIVRFAEPDQPHIPDLAPYRRHRLADGLLTRVLEDFASPFRYASSHRRAKFLVDALPSELTSHAIDGLP
jgi:hypothetical protein